MFNYTVSNFILLEIIFLYIAYALKYKEYFLFNFFSVYLGMRNFNIRIDTNTYIFTYLGGNGGYFSEKGFKYFI